MSVAIPIPLLQHLPDVNVSLGVGVDEYALCWDNDTAKFVLRAPAAPFAGILATGATVGATAQAQAFTLGVVAPFLAPAADATTAWQVRKADKTTAVVTVDTTNARVGIGTASPQGKLSIRGGSANWSTTFETSDYVYASVGSRLTLGHGATTGNTYSALQAETGGSTAVGNIVLNPSGGNVGIGTASPGYKFETYFGTASGGNDLTGLFRNSAGGVFLGCNGTDGLIGSYAAAGGLLFKVGNSLPTSAMYINSTGNVGIGTTAPAAKLHVDQSSTTGAVPVLTVDQADVSEEFIRFIGTSTTDASQSLVDAANMTTPGAIVGWLKIYVQDDQATNPITDGVYFVPFYAAPTA